MNNQSSKVSYEEYETIINFCEREIERVNLSILNYNDKIKIVQKVINNYMNYRLNYDNNYRSTSEVFKIIANHILIPDVNKLIKTMKSNKNDVKATASELKLKEEIVINRIDELRTYIDYIRKINDKKKEENNKIVKPVVQKPVIETTTLDEVEKIPSTEPIKKEPTSSKYDKTKNDLSKLSKEEIVNNYLELLSIVHRQEEEAIALEDQNINLSDKNKKLNKDILKIKKENEELKQAMTNPTADNPALFNMMNDYKDSKRTIVDLKASLNQISSLADKIIQEYDNISALYPDK